MIYTTLKSLVVSLMLLTGITSLSYADFYVIPVLKKMKNVVTVAKSGGNYKDVKSALASITDASETNPYLIYIGPGEYTVTSTAIVMKSFVTIMGSGEKATVLKGNISSGSFGATSAIITGENNATLGHLSVINEGGDGFSIAIFNYSASPVLRNITAEASGGSNENYGVYNHTSSSPTMNNVTATGSGGINSYGVVTTTSSSPIIRNCILSGSNAGICGGKASFSTIIGGGDGAACSLCVDGSSNELGSDCSPLVP